MIERWNQLDEYKRKKIVGLAISIICVLLIIILIIVIHNRNTEASVVDTESTQQNVSVDTTEVFEGTEVIDEEDPQNVPDGNMSNESGASVNIEDVISKKISDETDELTLGIDVSKYQGTIDWEQVANSGIDFAMIRVGYRTLKTGEIIADTNAKYNMQEATKHGIKIGVYFFSTAITESEAIEEADWVADYISKYQITYPVVYNCEGFGSEENRQYSLSKTERTDLALVFLNRISQKGYTPMFYASKTELENNAKWETSRIEPSYKIWVAQYPAKAYPETEKSSYSGKHDMWQYTNNGTVPGISKPVDMNVAYFGYTKTQDAKDDEMPESVEADVEALMNFKDVNETVTAKESTNLRNIPSQGSDSTVMYTLKNGEIATRTGISDSGWSRVVFNEQTYYAVSSYLTTDLSSSSGETESEETDVITTKFEETDELVTAKDAVNLRTLPSVTNPNSIVVAQIKNGDIVRRTGINKEYGWSRVEYNGQVLYCVSSYLTLAE